MHTETFRQPPYKVRQRKPDTLTENWLKQRIFISPILKEFFDPTAPIEKLHRGVKIRYRTEGSRELLNGVIYKRRSNDLTVLCLYRPEVHIITLDYGREDCKNYSVRIGKQQLATLKKQNTRKRNLMRFVEEMEKMISRWIKSDRFPKGSYIDEVARECRRNHKVPKSQLALTFKFISLLLRAHGQ